MSRGWPPKPPSWLSTIRWTGHRWWTPTWPSAQFLASINARTSSAHKPGDQVGALYLVYGPRTILTYSVGKGVHEFYLNEVGEFVLSKENMTMRDEVKTYAPGNLRTVVDTPAYYKMMNIWLQEGHTLRYSGGMVPDIHLMLVKGAGIFTNIGGSKYPQGKLRLLFECGPFAYIMENAGGALSDGERSILEVPIQQIDQRTPIIIGAKKEVQRVCQVLKT